VERLLEELRQEQLAAAGRVCAEAAERLEEAGLPATYSVASGSPVAGIAAAAREQMADLIVVGARGRSEVADVLLGSTALSVIKSAPCSILVGRSPAERQAPGPEVAGAHGG
jgi:nucleotide-binding universal stress UspA family protein